MISDSGLTTCPPDPSISITTQRPQPIPAFSTRCCRISLTCMEMRLVRLIGSAGKRVRPSSTLASRSLAHWAPNPREIVFTSGATESNNLAIKGVAYAATRRGKHLVTAVSEHKAVLDPMKRLAREGWEVTVVPCDTHGWIDPSAVAECAHGSARYWSRSWQPTMKWERSTRGGYR